MKLTYWTYLKEFNCWRQLFKPALPQFSILFWTIKSYLFYRKRAELFLEFLSKGNKQTRSGQIRLEDRVNIIESSWQTPQPDHTQQFLAMNNCITAVRNLIPKNNFAKCNCTCDTDIGRINNTISSLGSYFAKKSKLVEYAITHALDKLEQKLIFLEGKVPQAVNSCNCNCNFYYPNFLARITNI